MDIEQKWVVLSIELGFQFNKEIRPRIELPSLHAMAAKAIKSGDLKKVEALLKNPVLRKLVEQSYFGSATGVYRDFEFSLFRGAAAIHGDSTRWVYFVNVVLLFKKSLGMGLEIEANTFWSKLLKTLVGGSFVKIEGNSELESTISVKAKNKPRVKTLVAGRGLQEKLMGLYSFSRSFDITDHAIRYHEKGHIVNKEQALKIMDLMADAAAEF